MGFLKRVYVWALQNYKNHNLVRYVRGDVHGWYGHNGHIEQPPRSHQNKHDNSNYKRNQQYDVNNHWCNDNNNNETTNSLSHVVLNYIQSQELS